MALPIELPALGDYVRHHAAHLPDREALIHGGERISYAELRIRVEALARALLAAGVAKGDRVALLSTPRPDYFIVFLATVEIGAIWLGLHPRYKLPEFRHVIGETRPKMLFALPEIDGRDYAGDLRALGAEFDCIERIVTIGRRIEGAQALEEFVAGGGASDAALAAARGAVAPDDPALIIFTSGSTGTPKGAVLSHYGLIHGARVENERWPSRHHRVINNMPINHIACAGMLSVFALVGGGTLIFQDRFDAEGVLQLIQSERVTFWLQAPTMFHFTAAHPAFARHDLSSVEYIVWAGSPMARDLVARLHEQGAVLSTAFGMTELSTYITYSDLDAGFEVLAETIGRPEPRYELRLGDARGNPAPAGAEGEIQARGRWLMKGYFNQSAATAAAFTPDGWFRTGDVAIARPDGNWKLVGRMKEMYKSGGFNIYPREIEIAIEAHPDVAMAAVLGVADPVYQEVGHAFVQPQPGCSLTVEKLAAWCRERLANYKVPKKFTIMDELPRLPIGKIDKQSLRNGLASGRAAP